MRLSKEERVQLEQLRRQTRDKKQHVRLSVLIMLDEGYTHEVIAVSQGINADIIFAWFYKHPSTGKPAMGTRTPLPNPIR